MTFKREAIDDLVDKVARLLPDDAGLIRDELHQNLRATITATLKNMDLVTREEFDVQARLLAKTRLRLEEMQQQVEKLEALLEKEDR